MASGTTNIDDLPSETKGNISLETIEKPVQQSNQVSSHNQLSQDDINKIITGIQTASQHNLTTLPSRDIPMNTFTQVTDNQIQPNYIPENKTDYIKNEDNAQSIYEKHLAKEKNKIKQDEIYDQLQTPLMISILFLIFQLPIFNKTLFKYLPSLFLKDGSTGSNGHLFKSVLFGGVYFFIMKLINYLSDI
jgi:hypothetical protein